jgi:hypothetical protein
MTTKKKPGRQDRQDQHVPHRMRIPGFITDTDVGLGEVIKKATSTAGIRPCGGCAQRAQRLNNWMTFSPRPRTARR